jgi:hypothetical protein
MSTLTREVAREHRNGDEQWKQDRCTSDRVRP